MSFASEAVSAQAQADPCAGVKTGNFFYYSGYSGEMRTISMIRDTAVQKEIDGRDTTWFKTSWISECLLRLVFLRSTKKMTKEESDFYRQHAAFTQATSIQPEYYLFRGSLDSVRSGQTATDTMWRRPAAHEHPVPDSSGRTR